MKRFYSLEEAGKALGECEALERRVVELERRLEVALDALAGMVEEFCPARRMVHPGRVLASQEAFMVLEGAGWMRSDIGLDVYWLLPPGEREGVGDGG